MLFVMFIKSCPGCYVFMRFSSIINTLNKATRYMQTIVPLLHMFYYDGLYLCFHLKKSQGNEPEMYCTRYVFQIDSFIDQFCDGYLIISQAAEWNL